MLSTLETINKEKFENRDKLQLQTRLKKGKSKHQAIQTETTVGESG
jgi:hypothetical protein